MDPSQGQNTGGRTTTKKQPKGQDAKILVVESLSTFSSASHFFHLRFFLSLDQALFHQRGANVSPPPCSDVLLLTISLCRRHFTPVFRCSVHQFTIAVTRTNHLHRPQYEVEVAVKGRQGATVGLAAFQSHLYQVTSGTDVSSSKVRGHIWLPSSPTPTTSHQAQTSPAQR